MLRIKYDVFSKTITEAAIVIKPIINKGANLEDAQPSRADVKDEKLIVQSNYRIYDDTT